VSTLSPSLFQVDTRPAITFVRGFQLMPGMFHNCLEPPGPRHWDILTGGSNMEMDM